MSLFRRRPSRDDLAGALVAAQHAAQAAGRRAWDAEARAVAAEQWAIDAERRATRAQRTIDGKVRWVVATTGNDVEDALRAALAAPGARTADRLADAVLACASILAVDSELVTEYRTVMPDGRQFQNGPWLTADRAHDAVRFSRQEHDRLLDADFPALAASYPLRAQSRTTATTPWTDVDTPDDD